MLSIVVNKFCYHYATEDNANFGWLRSNNNTCVNVEYNTIILTYWP